MSANALLVRWPGGFHWVTAVPGGAIRREAPMGTSANSLQEAVRVGEGQLAILADVREEITVKLDVKVDADRYGIGWRKGDTVEVADHAGNVTQQRVMSATRVWDGQKIDTIPQLKDIISTEQERFAEMVTKQLAGALQGVTRAPQPVSTITANTDCCPPAYEPGGEG